MKSLHALLPDVPSEIRPKFADHVAIRKDVCAMFRPPELRTVVDVVQGLKIGGSSDEFSIEVAPMMREPMNNLLSREYEAIVYCGPARTGKTAALIDGSLAYIVLNDPADTMIVQMSDGDARDFSIRRVDRMFRNNERLTDLLPQSAQDDNVYDKRMRNGMLLTIGYPSAKQLSSKDQRFMLLTDYDRMPDSIDGHGAVFDLAAKRTQTFMSAGMSVVESSPGKMVTRPDWRPTSAHEAPPVNGILGLYNMGTRALYFWRCDHCHQYSEFTFEETVRWQGWDEMQSDDPAVLLWPKTLDVEEAAQSAHFVCPKCNGSMPASAKHRLNLDGLWVHEGQTIVDGVVTGMLPRSTILSYWQKGTTAAFQSLSSLTRNYLRAVRHLAQTGDEEPLKTTTNQDQGVPYTPLHVRRQKTSSSLKERAIKESEQGVVPTWARFLLATVDVQVDSFQVLVSAHGPGNQIGIIDRYQIAEEEESLRRLSPHAYSEDWLHLESLVMDRDFELADGSGRMRIKATAIDTGGTDGVTQKAYAFWRRMWEKNKHDRVALLKGRVLRDDGKAAELVQRMFPETKASETAGLQGLVPLHMVLVNNFKSQLATLLDRRSPGDGFIHLPAWMDDAHFDELTAEYRDDRGRWVKKPGRRNETWDLLVYQLALRWYLKAHLINWDDPPLYARAWASNSLVRLYDGEATDAAKLPPAVINRGRRRLLNRGIARV